MKKGEKKKQQKALARRTERKTAQRTARAMTQVSPVLSVIRQARNYPLLGCWVPPNWDQNGLAVVVVARRQPEGLVAFGTFLVDYFCLGIKNVIFNADVPYSRFINEHLPKMMMGQQPMEIAPDLAHELIYGGVAYAARWGFRPHSDFKIAQLVLDPPEEHPLTGRIQFGKDDKPFFISGPRDNVNAIIHQLIRTAGEGNFNYLAHLGEPPFDLLPDDADEVEE